MQFMGKYGQLLNGLHNELLEHILLRAWKCEYHCMHLFLIIIIINLLCIASLALVPDLNYFSFLTCSEFHLRDKSLLRFCYVDISSSLTSQGHLCVLVTTAMSTSVISLSNSQKKSSMLKFFSFLFHFLISGYLISVAPQINHF